MQFEGIELRQVLLIILFQGIVLLDYIIYFIILKINNVVKHFEIKIFSIKVLYNMQLSHLMKLQLPFRLINKNIQFHNTQLSQYLLLVTFNILLFMLSLVFFHLRICLNIRSRMNLNQETCVTKQLTRYTLMINMLLR